MTTSCRPVVQQKCYNIVKKRSGQVIFFVQAASKSGLLLCLLASLYLWSHCLCAFKVHTTLCVQFNVSVVLHVQHSMWVFPVDHVFCIPNERVYPVLSMGERFYTFNHVGLWHICHSLPVFVLHVCAWLSMTKIRDSKWKPNHVTKAARPTVMFNRLYSWTGSQRKGSDRTWAALNMTQTEKGFALLIM